MKDRMEFTGEDNQATREQPHAFSRGAVTQEKSLFMYSYFIHGFMLLKVKIESLTFHVCENMPPTIS